MGPDKDLNVVLGASGGLGNAMAHVLAEAGERIRAVNRSGKVDVPEGVELHAADLSDEESTRTACEGASVVYMCANAPYDKWPDMLPPMMRNVIKACAETGARMVFGDNLYAYGFVDGPIREDSPRAAKGSKGNIRIVLEDMVMEAHADGELKAAIGRASDFYGPYAMAGSGDLMFVPALTGGTAKALGKIDMPHTWSYTRDFARGLHILGREDRALGEIWHVPSAETLTTRQFIEMIYEEAGAGVPKIQAAGNAVVTVMGWFNPIMREVKEMMYEWNNPYIVDHSKFEAAFGNPSTPHRQAINETLDWFRKQLAAKESPKS